MTTADRKIADDMLMVMQLIARHHEYPTAFGVGPDFERIVAEWRPELMKEG